ncbi:hypothetical protein WG906_10595 [Pedobacter sp. P351]|uniref:hypothetical protein n=1 Tax=Pedobacter superstes TaxID=3133441 RepID=UPI003094E925
MQSSREEDLTIPGTIAQFPGDIQTINATNSYFSGIINFYLKLHQDFIMITANLPILTLTMSTLALKIRLTNYPTKLCKSNDVK